jgi:hypothetical protein
MKSLKLKGSKTSRSAKSAKPATMLADMVKVCKRNDKIRARKSYRLWLSLSNFLASKPGEAEILVKFYIVLGLVSGFGRATGGSGDSYLAWESLKQLMKDTKLTNWKLVVRKVERGSGNYGGLEEAEIRLFEGCQ